MPGDLPIMAEHALFHRIQCRLRLLPIALQHVEGNLGIENIFGQRLKGEQVHSLLMQFVHTALSMLGCRLENGRDRAPDCARLLGTQQQQRQHNRRGMRRNARAGLQFRRRDLLALALDPQRTNGRSRFTLQSRRQVDDGAAGVPGAFPVLARAVAVGREESEVHVFELLGTDALDETDFVAHGFELAQGFVVIEQTNIHGREVALVQHFRDFLAFERGGAHNRGAIEISARYGRMGWVWGLCGLAHEVCEASLSGGGGGSLRRPDRLCKRQKTPESGYSRATPKSTGREKNQIPANNAARNRIRRKGWRERKSMSLKL